MTDENQIHKNGSDKSDPNGNVHDNHSSSRPLDDTGESFTDDPFLEKLVKSARDAEPLGAEQAETLERGLAEAIKHRPSPRELLKSIPGIQPARDPEYLGTIGPYDIIDVIGHGGMGIVLKCHEESLNRFVAIKIMHPHLAADASWVQRFAQEAQRLAAVRHESIVTIHAVDESNGTPYLVMEYVRGRTLEQVIEEDGQLEIDQLARIARQIAEALQCAHKEGIIHRDIKPSNILLENHITRVKVTDFGLAQVLADVSRITSPGDILGTPRYMSPEQAEGKTIDEQSDIFSLGAVMYEMATGKPPFSAENPHALMAKIINDTPNSIRQLNPKIPVWFGPAHRSHDVKRSRQSLSQRGCHPRIEK